MLRLSVVICTHNPRPDYLHRVIEGLKAQTLPRTRWELLIVDNASATPPIEVRDLAWHPSASIVREDALGLTAARIRGIATTAGDLIVFVDDDNVLAPDYLERVLDVHARFPQLGAFGAGSIEPEFETPPTREIRRHLPLLALRSVPTARWSNQPAVDAIPWGAGLVVVRSLADRYQAFVDQLGIGSVVDRRGGVLHSGGDDLFSWLAMSHGFGFGIFPQLRVTHLISRHRTSRSYVVTLIHDHAFSAAVRRCVLTGVRPARLGWASYPRLALHGLRRGPFSLRCRWAAVTASHRAARFLVETDLARKHAARTESVLMPETAEGG